METEAEVYKPSEEYKVERHGDYVLNLDEHGEIVLVSSCLRHIVTLGSEVESVRRRKVARGARGKVVGLFNPCAADRADSFIVVDFARRGIHLMGFGDVRPVVDPKIRQQVEEALALHRGTAPPKYGVVSMRFGLGEVRIGEESPLPTRDDIREIEIQNRRKLRENGMSAAPQLKWRR